MNLLVRRIGFLGMMVTVIIITAPADSAHCAAAEPLVNAHAHNDYEHQRPLADALDHGFCSVEADVHLFDGRLLVAHDREDVTPARTLESLYLDPLLDRVRTHAGRVYPGGPAFTLFIDIKSEGAATYAELAKVLATYEEMLTTVRQGNVVSGAVTVIISGNRARQLIASADIRHAGIDGRLTDLDSDAAVHLMPLISDRWSSHFRWNGTGAMPDAEREKLREVVDKAHRRGRRVRFWATPERIVVWRELKAAGVDLINTDDLAGLEKFLRGE